MKEQSHKDEMSAALRGDFARLRERGVSATLAPAERPAPVEPVVEDPPPVKPDEAEAPPENDARERERTGIFGRLFGR